MNGAIKARLPMGVTVMLALAGIGAALAFAAGGSAADDGVVRVAMRDGAIELERTELAAGRVVLDVVNEGSAEHEVVVLETDEPADELPVGLHGVSIAQAGKLVVGEDHVANGHRHQPGQELGLPPGESRRYQVDLEPGSYVVYCQTGSHYLAGERTAFTVR